VAEQEWRNGVNRELGLLIGKVEALTESHEALRDDIQGLRKELGKLKEAVGFLRGKSAVWGALGGTLAGAIAQAVIAILRR